MNIDILVLSVLAMGLVAGFIIFIAFIIYFKIKK